MIHHSGVLDSGGVKATAVRIAEAKVQLGFGSAFLRGVLCNVLVCLAVWLSLAARSVEGKVLAIVFPISAFVALGFEHCVANLYLIPIGVLSGAHVTVSEFVNNAVAVTLVLAGERCYSLIDGERADWEPLTVMITPPTAFHSHHNEGNELALFLIVQDGGVYYHCRTMGFSYK